jgi:hypothetical protein
MAFVLGTSITEISKADIPNKKALKSTPHILGKYSFSFPALRCLTLIQFYNFSILIFQQIYDKRKHPLPTA